MHQRNLRNVALKSHAKSLACRHAITSLLETKIAQKHRRQAIERYMLRELVECEQLDVKAISAKRVKTNENFNCSLH
jgi:hypothetical protein